MGYKPYDPLQDRKRSWRSRLMVPGAIAALLLVVAAGTTLTVIGVLRLMDGSSVAETGVGASSSTRTAVAPGERQPIVPLPTVAPTAVPTFAPTAEPTAQPSPVPTPVPTITPTPPPAPTAVVVEVIENRAKEVFDRLTGSVVRISTASGNVGIGQPYSEAGSGFVIDEAGYILTNYHVIKDARSIQITLSDEVTQGTARIVGTDPGSDVALLKANDGLLDKLVVAPLGSSAAVEVGDQVIAIGSQYFAYQNSLTTGIVGGLNRPYAFSGRTITGMIQFDAAINRGSSGGPLIDLRQGAVIGINTAIQSSNFAGIALALPIDRIKAILPDLRAGITPQHAWLAIYGASITPQLAAHCSLPVDFGVIVYSILPGSTLNIESDETKTFKTGANGDIIVSIDDLPVRNLNELSRYVDAHKKPGDVVEIRVYRERKYNELLEVTLEEWPNKEVRPLTQAVDCSKPTSEPINAPTVPPITAEITTNAASGRFIISAEPLIPAMAAATSPITAPPAMPTTMPRAAMRSDEPIAAVSVTVA